jgi:hypothetical protein
MYLIRPKQLFCERANVYMATLRCTGAIAHTFESILSIDIIRGAIQASDRVNHDRQQRVGHNEVDDGQEHNKGTEKHINSISRKQPSRHCDKPPPLRSVLMASVPRDCQEEYIIVPRRWQLYYVIKAIGNNEERKEITARRHKILTWKTLSNKEK